MNGTWTNAMKFKNKMIVAYKKLSILLNIVFTTYCFNGNQTELGNFLKNITPKVYKGKS